MSDSEQSIVPALIAPAAAGGARRSAAVRWVARLGVLGLSAMAFLAAGEGAARLDDWLFSETGFLSNPDREQDLLQAEAWGTHGRPNGRFRKWQLNNFGFLGPDISEKPQGRRIMVMGASETFGLYERTGNDYPAQLGRALLTQKHADAEVVNAGVAGMALPSLTTYWENWVSRFSPSVVVVYPSTHFYLDAELPRAPRPSAFAPERPADRFRSRFVERLADKVRQNEILREFRSRLVVGRAVDASKPGDMITAETAPARLKAFITDLERLGEAIERRGAKPVLVTHAFKTSSPPEPRDMAELRYFRIFMPLASPERIAAFVHAAGPEVVALGKRRGWTVIDAGGALSARRELFADPVHLNDEGSRLMAELLAAGLAPVLAPGPSAPRPPVTPGKSGAP